MNRDYIRYGKDKMYLRKHGPDPNPRQAQASNQTPANELTVSECTSANEVVASEPTPLEEHQLPDPQLTNNDLAIAIRKVECTKRPFYPLSHFVSFKKFSPAHRNFLMSPNEIFIPNNLSKALSNKEWRKAMRVEMDVLEKNGTWELVDLPKGNKIVG